MWHEDTGKDRIAVPLVSELRDWGSEPGEVVCLSRGFPPVLELLSFPDTGLSTGSALKVHRKNEIARTG